MHGMNSDNNIPKDDSKFIGHLDCQWLCHNVVIGAVTNRGDEHAEVEHELSECPDCDESAEDCTCGDWNEQSDDSDFDEDD